MAQTTYIPRKGQDADFADVTVSGALSVTGASTFTGAPTFTGVVTASAGVKIPVQVISGDGAITIRNGIVILTKGTAAAITLAAPTAGTHDGVRISVIAGTAAAHVLTVTGGAGGAGQDVGTFGGAINDSCALVAYNGAWYIETAPRNVTFA